MSKKSRSLIAGGLTSSAGIFITKVLGIVYLPFLTALSGSTSTLSFYTKAYGYYNYVLLISSAGIPFAIATLVAKYYGKEDYKTMLLVRKIGISVMLVLGFVSMVLFMSLSGVLAQFTNSVQTSPEDIQKTINVYIIISMALFAVPLLSGHRGFFQGIKDFKTYAFSQILEQVARIAFMLSLGALAVYVFHKEGIWAVYFAVGSAAFSAVVAVLHLTFFRKGSVNEIRVLASKQESSAVDRKSLINEFMYFAIPFLLYSVFGSSNIIAHNLFFERAMDFRNVDVNTIQALNSMIGATTDKITSIPQVLALGFSPAIIPFITEAIERKDKKALKKNIMDAISAVLYIGLPICFFILVIPTEIYYVMYGKDFLLGGEVLRWATLTAFFGTVSPICNSLMMALRFRRQNLFILIVGFIIKMSITIPFIIWFGYSGDITSTAIVSAIIITFDLYIIHKEYQLDFKQLGKKIGGMLLALLVAYIAMILLQNSSFNVLQYKRVSGIFVLGVYGVIGLGIYFLITSFFKLPEEIFGFNLVKLFKKGRKKIQ